jgi:hypothetical protein
MENQHKHIKGYRDLTPEEIALMNEIKEEGERLGALITKLDAMKDDGPFDDCRRWVAIGRTQLQQGLMALTRAVAKPTTF